MDWIELISNVGFPIVLCGVMAFFIKYLIDKYTTIITNLNEEHKKEVNELKTAIENNTLIITKFIEKMESSDTKCTSY